MCNVGSVRLCACAKCVSCDTRKWAAYEINTPVPLRGRLAVKSKVSETSQAFYNNTHTSTHKLQCSSATNVFSIKWLHIYTCTYIYNISMCIYIQIYICIPCWLMPHIFYDFMLIFLACRNFSFLPHLHFVVYFFQARTA